MVLRLLATILQSRKFCKHKHFLHVPFDKNVTKLHMHKPHIQVWGILFSVIWLSIKVYRFFLFQYCCTIPSFNGILMNIDNVSNRSIVHFFSNSHFRSIYTKTWTWIAGIQNKSNDNMPTAYYSIHFLFRWCLQCFQFFSTTNFSPQKLSSVWLSFGFGSKSPQRKTIPNAHKVLIKTHTIFSLSYAYK